MVPLRKGDDKRPVALCLLSVNGLGKGPDQAAVLMNGLPAPS